MRDPTPKGPTPKVTSPKNDSTAPGEDIEEQIAKLRAVLRSKRQKKKGPRVSAVPLRLYEDNLPEKITVQNVLKRIQMPTMTFGEFMDITRGFKGEMLHWLQPSSKPEYKKTRKAPRRRFAQAELSVVEENSGDSRSVPAKSAGLETTTARGIQAIVANSRYEDIAAKDDSKTYLRFIKAKVDDHLVYRCLVDCGSLTELISSTVAEKLGLTMLKVPGPALYLRMADDSASPITHFVRFPLVVGGVLSVVTAYVAGTSHSYNILLGKGWLRRNRAVIHFADNKMSITGQRGLTYTAHLHPSEPHGQRVSTHPDVDDLVDNDTNSTNTSDASNKDDETEDEFDSDDDADDMLISNILHVASMVARRRAKN